MARIANNPYVWLLLAILDKAKKGNTQMWKDFEKEHDLAKRSIDSFDTALWVTEWWHRKDNMKGGGNE